MYNAQKGFIKLLDEAKVLENSNSELVKILNFNINTCKLLLRLGEDTHRVLSAAVHVYAFKLSSDSDCLDVPPEMENAVNMYLSGFEKVRLKQCLAGNKTRSGKFASPEAQMFSAIITGPLPSYMVLKDKIFIDSTFGKVKWHYDELEASIELCIKQHTTYYAETILEEASPMWSVIYDQTGGDLKTLVERLKALTSGEIIEKYLDVSGIEIVKSRSHLNVVK